MDKTKDSYSNAYKEAGVDVTAGYESIRLFKDKVRSTYVPGVLGDIGGFGGLFEPNFAGMKRPVTVSGTILTTRVADIYFSIYSLNRPMPLGS